MNLSVPQVQKIIEESQSLESPWRERFIAMAQDWVEMLKSDFDKIHDGVSLAKNLKLGAQVIAELDAIEAILKLPLCPSCRKLIGGDHFSVIK